MKKINQIVALLIGLASIPVAYFNISAGIYTILFVIAMYVSSMISDK